MEDFFCACAIKGARIAPRFSALEDAEEIFRLENFIAEKIIYLGAKFDIRALVKRVVDDFAYVDATRDRSYGGVVFEKIGHFELINNGCYEFDLSKIIYIYYGENLNLCKVRLNTYFDLE